MECSFKPPSPDTVFSIPEFLLNSEMKSADNALENSELITCSDTQPANNVLVEPITCDTQSADDALENSKPADHVFVEPITCDTKPVTYDSANDTFVSSSVKRCAKTANVGCGKRSSPPDNVTSKPVIQKNTTDDSNKMSGPSSYKIPNKKKTPISSNLETTDSRTRDHSTYFTYKQISHHRGSISRGT